MNRRKRLSRPKTLVFFGFVFLILPFLNYYSISAQTGIEFFQFKEIFSKLNFLEIFLLFASIPVGFGLLLVKRWGWFSFILYSTLLISYNLFGLIQSKEIFDLAVLGRTVLGTLVVLYFCRKDISAPYFKMYPRGWRFQKRKPIELDVVIDNKNYKTKDISGTGVYVETDLNPELNTELKLSLKLPNEVLDLTAGVVRIDSEGIGLAFRNLNPSTKKNLEHLEVG
jgi:hypothetical protein